ncbi:hypothetical protein ACIHAA_29175 [Streptomyces sp. NPDC052040]|uniref:hypothetical protein n=1 Tax=unclassified Streptomyces TaxID=2593676 RepID=UPI0037D22F6E
MPTRTFAVTAAGVAAAVLATTGITYASSVESTEAAPPAKHVVAKKAAHLTRPAKKAPTAQHAAPAAPVGAARGGGNEGRGGRDEGGAEKGRDHGGGHGGGHHGPGWIHFNERTYSAAAEGCITAASGPGSTSFSIDNDSDKYVEVYRGFTCDNGSPVATVGPHGSTFGVVPSTSNQGDPFRGDGFFPGGMFDDGVVGSFRVVCRDDAW